MALVELGSRVEVGVRERARPVLKRLARELGETAVLSVVDGGEAVALDQAFGGRHMVQVRYQPGFRHPLAVGAHGRAILAFAEAAMVQDALAAAADAAALRQALALTRERGWAYSHDELQLGASGLAVPLFDEHGHAIASVGIVAPVSRFPDTAEVAAVTLKAVAAAQGPALPGETRAG
jgi:IclR family transcriptional regulator, KDG regulon repressor